MYTFTAHAVGRSLLFLDWKEGCQLWRMLVQHCPDLSGLVLMPNHVHLDKPSRGSRGLVTAMGAYAQWRNRQRGARGRVWETCPPGRQLSGRKHVRRNLRYLHLNPCRARLVACPLAWPLSTHRDLVGLVVTPVRPKAGDPDDEHRYISSDPSCAVTGTQLPHDRQRGDRPPLGVLAGAVSELLRVPLSDLQQRGPARRTFVGAARAMTTWSGGEIGRAVGLNRSSISRTEALDPRTTDTLARMLVDPRFPGLAARDPRLRHW